MSRSRSDVERHISTSVTGHSEAVVEVLLGDHARGRNCPVCKIRLQRREYFKVSYLCSCLDVKFKYRTVHQIWVPVVWNMHPNILHDVLTVMTVCNIFHKPFRYADLGYFSLFFSTYVVLITPLFLSAVGIVYSSVRTTTSCGITFARNTELRSIGSSEYHVCQRNGESLVGGSCVNVFYFFSCY